MSCGDRNPSNRGAICDKPAAHVDEDDEHRFGWGMSWPVLRLTERDLEALAAIARGEDL